MNEDEVAALRVVHDDAARATTRDHGRLFSYGGCERSVETSAGSA